MTIHIVVFPRNVNLKVVLGSDLQDCALWPIGEPSKKPTSLTMPLLNPLVKTNQALPIFLSGYESRDRPLIATRETSARL
jgi:hypothetical protein